MREKIYSRIRIKARKRKGKEEKNTHHAMEQKYLNTNNLQIDFSIKAANA